ncbi:MAG: hypothetical protein U9R19_10580 [Bacteroidota bacterium]|nr:hypothetical protein [Bacteroidota bacterium]
MMKNTIHKVSCVITFFLILNLSMVFALDPPPPGSDPTGTGDPLGGGAPIGSGVGILLLMGAGYLGKKTYNAFKYKK